MLTVRDKYRLASDCTGTERETVGIAEEVQYSSRRELQTYLGYSGIAGEDLGNQSEDRERRGKQKTNEEGIGSDQVVDQ